MVGCEESRIVAESSPEEPFSRSSRHSTAVSGVVDRVGGAGPVIVQVNVAYESDPEVVRELLIAAAKAQESVLSIPAPQALLHEFGDWALKFELICFVDDIVTAERAQRTELRHLPPPARGGAQSALPEVRRKSPPPSSVTAYANLKGGITDYGITVTVHLIDT
jgi:hypothetical protein